MAEAQAVGSSSADWRIPALAEAILQRMSLQARPPKYDRDAGREAVAMSREQWQHHVEHIVQLANVGRSGLGLSLEGANLSEDFETGRDEADVSVRKTVRHRKFIRHLAATTCTARGVGIDELSAQVFGIIDPNPALGLTFQDYRAIVTGNVQERVCAPIAKLAECAALLKARVPYEQAAAEVGLSRDQARDLSVFLGTSSFREEQKAGPKQRWVALARSAGWSGAEFARRWNAAVQDHGLGTITDRTARNWLAEGMAA